MKKVIVKRRVIEFTRQDEELFSIVKKGLGVERDVEVFRVLLLEKAMEFATNSAPGGGKFGIEKETITKN